MNNPDSAGDDKILYRFEFIDAGMRIVEWLWLLETEQGLYRANDDHVIGLNARTATSEEVELYHEAYEDGYGIAQIEEAESTWNGLSFAMHANKSKVTGYEISEQKIFQCAMCGKQKDFLNEVAVIHSGSYYLATLRGDMLWFNCYDCATLTADISAIEIEDDGDNEPR